MPDNGRAFRARITRAHNRQDLSISMNTYKAPRKADSLTAIQIKKIDRLKKYGLKDASLLGQLCTEYRENPYSHVRLELEPLAACIYDWIVQRDMGNQIAAGKVPRSAWDSARYLFLELWPDEYYALID